jgi:hypothetical protein
MLLSKWLNVATTMNVVATAAGVFVNDVGPFRHAGGGVLELNGQEAKWLFTRTGHEVIVQKSDALAFRMFVKKPWQILLNLSWLAAMAASGLIVLNLRAFLGFRGLALLGRSLFVALLALSAIIVVVLLPYWGLIGIRV